MTMTPCDHQYAHRRHLWNHCLRGIGYAVCLPLQDETWYFRRGVGARAEYYVVYSGGQARRATEEQAWNRAQTWSGALTQGCRPGPRNKDTV